MGVIVYTSKTCAYCPMVKKFLSAKGVEFEERSTEVPEYAQEVFEKTGMLSVPIVIKDTMVIIGYNLAQLSLLA